MDDTAGLPAMPEIVANSSGGYREWEPPEQGREYVIGMDASEGRSKTSDATSITVWRRSYDELVQVAEWYGRIRQGQAGDTVCFLGARFNWALINCERNVSGAVEYALRRNGYPDERLFCPPMVHHIAYDIPTKQVFTPTTGFSKKTLIDMLAMYMAGKQRIIRIRSWELVEELAKLVRDTSNKVDTGGKDRTMACVMAVYADANTPLASDPTPVEKDDDEPPPWGVDPNAWKRNRARASAGLGDTQHPEVPEFEEW